MDTLAEFVWGGGGDQGIERPCSVEVVAGLYASLKHIWKGVHEFKLEQNEDGDVFRLDKTFVGCGQDLFLLFAYIRPNTSSKHDVMSYIDCYDMVYWSF